MRHRASVTVHAVPAPYGGLRAVCGEDIGLGGNTGRIPPLSNCAASGDHVCAACLEVTG